jgi:hypothetical protein
MFSLSSPSLLSVAAFARFDQTMRTQFTQATLTWICFNKGITWRNLEEPDLAVIRLILHDASQQTR